MPRRAAAPGRQFVATTSTRSISRWRISLPRGSLRFSEMLRFPRFVPSPMCVPAQNVSCSAWTLITSAPRSASIFGAKGPATPRPRSSTVTPSRGEAGTVPVPVPRAGTGRPAVGRGGGLGTHRRGVLARARRGRARRARRVTELEHRSDVADAPLVGVVDLDDAAVGEEGRVRQRLGDRPHTRDAHLRGVPRGRPLVRREPPERRRERRVQEDAGEQAVGLHADPVGIVAVRGVEPDGAQLVALGRREHPARPDRPVVHPPAVGALVEPLDRAAVDRPHPVQRRVRVLDPLPVQRDGGERTLQQRRLDPLPEPGRLADVQRRRDAQRREVRRAEAGPGRAREDRSRPVGAAHHAVGRAELGVRAGPPGDVLQGGAAPALLVEEQAGARGNERVVPGPVAVAVAAPVPGDRAVHEARVRGAQGCVVDAESLGHAGGEAVDDDVGPGCQREELVAVAGRAQVEHRAALAAVPHARTRLGGERVAARRLDPGHHRAVVGEQHRGHRAGDAPRQVEDAQAVEHRGHVISYRCQTRVALPATMSARSSSETSAN